MKKGTIYQLKNYRTGGYENYILVGKHNDAFVLVRDSQNLEETLEYTRGEIEEGLQTGWLKEA